MSEYALRPAASDDLDAIMAIETAVFVNDAWSPAAMRRDLANPSCHYLVAVDESDAVVGYAGLLAAAGTGEGDIQTIAVAPTARRTGLGRRLMTALLDEARRRRVREVFLDVRVDNPNAQALYRSLGFEEIGVRKRYYQPDDVDALVMRLQLPKEEVA
ncbi:ribosomal protein S18-alanine N-acetyltransferase [Desertivibrio insolitus]|uniref:ribosomal protein S18-alanine N-acetyltransferase n=1 Tax=Herbiconiux sp. SYSU D00978 TaxID=2812562 RepID=UPI0027DE7226|nr:ribosomal protein S18-alanine N-acetyltransferase [Herbiconiux sp. SYSU D00978]